jgi:uncharacterized YccA/Bax inhibitor family protein
MSSKNPVLKSSVIEKVSIADSSPMTVQGAVQKTGILLGLAVLAAAFSWSRVKAGQPDAFVWVGVGLVLGLVACLATVFKMNWSPVTAPAYAVFEGLVLGGVSAFFDAKYPGIALQACMLTFGTLFGLLGAYRLGWIRATEQFKAVVIAGTMAVGLVYLVSAVVRLFGGAMPFIHDSGNIGILFSGVVVVIAAMNLILDFDFMERAAEVQAPKYMEWYSAFGLMVSLIWLYMEILDLLVKLARRR